MLLSRPRRATSRIVLLLLLLLLFTFFFIVYRSLPVGGFPVRRKLSSPELPMSVPVLLVAGSGRRIKRWILFSPEWWWSLLSRSFLRELNLSSRSQYSLLGS